MAAELTAAASDGRLERVLAARAPGARERLGQRLLAAAEDGTLERILQEKVGRTGLGRSFRSWFMASKTVGGGSADGVG